MGRRAIPRSQKGRRPYQKIEGIMKVKGIKEGTFDKIKEYITVK